MKLEVEMTAEQLNLLILATEVYARALMNQPDLVADILAEDRVIYDKNDSGNDKRFHEWFETRSDLTEKLRFALNIMFRDSYKKQYLSESYRYMACSQTFSIQYIRQ